MNVKIKISGIFMLFTVLAFIGVGNASEMSLIGDVFGVLSISFFCLMFLPFTDSSIFNYSISRWRVAYVSAAVSAVSLILYALYIVTMHGDIYFENHLASAAPIIFIITAPLTAIIATLVHIITVNHN